MGVQNDQVVHVDSEGHVDLAAVHNARLERFTLIYLFGLVLVLSTVIAQMFFEQTIASDIAAIPAVIGAFLLGAPLFMASIREVRSGRISTSSLAALAILATIGIQEYVLAGFLAFILLLANQFVNQRAYGAERAIQDLVGLTPDTARVVRDGQEMEIALTEVKVGDVIRVRPGENLPVDGVVRAGSSSINQASLTGEALPHEVQPGEPVYAGTTNLSSVIDLEATLVGDDTTIGKVSQLIRAAEEHKTVRQLLLEQVAQFFVPLALGVAFVVWYWTDQPTRAISVLVVMTPAALLLSSPAAMVAAFAAAARLGILIKKPEYLEAAGAVDTVVMDKTGTITTGRFQVSRLVPAEGVEGAQLLQAAVNGEQHSNHPLARSILQTGEQARITPDGTTDFEELHGRGIRAATSLGQLHVGRRTWMSELFPKLEGELRDVESRIEGMTGVHVVLDGRYLGVVGLEDAVRKNTRSVVAHLRELGVRSIAIFTGDRLSVAERVGRAVGVDRIEAECLPEEKHALIESMTDAGRRVMMVGDGINDGPSLAAADVGVAMGLGGSDIAANSAGVALMTDDLSRTAFLIELARKTRAITGQNIAASIIIAMIGLVGAATGTLFLVLAALYQFVGVMFVMGNSFRLLRFGEAFTEGEPSASDQVKSIRRGEEVSRRLTVAEA